MQVAAASRDRAHNLRRDNHQQLIVLLVQRSGLKQLAQQWHVSEHRNLSSGLRQTPVQQPADCEALARIQFDLRADPPSVKSRNLESLEGQALVEYRAR